MFEIHKDGFSVVRLEPVDEKTKGLVESGGIPEA